ncbi:hypothetical protein HY772_08275, partial [Candidatus Woesearchaeota archaeon]|nr:hypothetical protein [Candidatus Woesearchaeota archaeon]
MLRSIFFFFLGVFCLLLAGVVCFTAYERYFDGRVYPGVWLGEEQEFTLRGKTAQDITVLVENFEQQLDRDQIVFSAPTQGKDGQAGKKEIKVSPVLTSSDPALARELIS